MVPKFCPYIRDGFQQGQDFCTKFDPLNDFLYGMLHIILKPRNVKICEHSIFFSIIKQKYV